MEPEHQIVAGYGPHIQLLVAAREAAYDGHDKLAVGLLNAAKACPEVVDDHVFWAMYDAIFGLVFWCRQCSKAGETEIGGIHKRFAANISSLLPEAKIVDGPKHPNHYPDFWVEVAGELCPVEIKKGPFTVAGVRQLERYMKVFNATRGYAVGPELKADLKEGMVFVLCH